MNHIFSKNNLCSRQTIGMMLIVLCAAILTVLVINSGPRIRATTLRETARNQSYTMTFNADIQTEIENFAITPAIKTTVNVSENKVVVSFNEPLLYSQDYTLSYSSTDNDNRSALVSSTFTTSSKTGFYLTRNPAGSDSIQSFSPQNDQESKTIYEADEIILYAMAQTSFAVLENSYDSQRLFHVDGSSKKEIILPSDKTIDGMKGSSTKNSYVMRLLDSESFKSSLWEYSAEDAVLTEITDDTGESIQASNVDYAPDGESIVYQDENRVLILRNFSTMQPALNFGEFDILRRFLPNEKAIFGYRNNEPIAVQASDGSFIEPPEQAILSYQALLMQDLESYVYFTQRFNEQTRQLEQLVLSTEDGEDILFYTAPLDSSLLLSLSVSPNDQYIFVEETTRPAIYDDRQPNAKPNNTVTTVYSREDASKVRVLSGFDIQWQ